MRIWYIWLWLVYCLLSFLFSFYCMLSYKFLLYCVLSCLRMLIVYPFPVPFLRNHFLMSFCWALEIFPMNTSCCKASSDFVDYYPFMLFLLIFPFNLLVPNLLTFFEDCRNPWKHKLLWYLLKLWKNVKPIPVC